MKYVDFIILILLFSLMLSCEWEKIPGPRIPNIPEQTELLEAMYIESDAPVTMNSQYWSEANYVIIDLQELSTGKIPEEDGLLNMTGTFNGLSDFGDSIGLKLMALYDDEYFYILAEWNDSKVDASNRTWLWNGPGDELKSDDTAGWTSQRNDDNIFFHFDIDESEDIKDVWKWSLALSEPTGHAIDMFQINDSIVDDEGSVMFVRNGTGKNNRQGPAFEWDGILQTIENPDGNIVALDPAYYLINKSEFLGDPEKGDLVFIATCQSCHGVNGSGEGPDAYAPRLDGTGLNRLSRTALHDYSSSSSHDGRSYFEKLSDDQITDLFARIRSISGVPGYYLTIPEGSTADVIARSNIPLGKISSSNDSGYKVFMKRKLNTGQSDDIQFDLKAEKVYTFDVGITNNDDINYIGSTYEQLIFK